MGTLLQLRRTVRSRLATPATDGFLTDETLTEHINLAIQAVEAEHRWPWQEAVATGSVAAASSTMTMPDDWRATKSLIVGFVELEEITFAELATQWQADDVASPRVFALVDRLAYIRPQLANDLAFSHVYYRSPILLSGDMDRPQMPVEYDPAIIAKACELLSIREDDRGSATAHAAEFADWVTRMRRDTRRTTKPRAPRVRPGGWL